MNLEGEFTRAGGLYVDSVGSVYGMEQTRQCRWYYAEVVGKRAIVRSRQIAEYKNESHIITLNYPTGVVVYLKLKRGSFEEFLIENTITGDLVEALNIRFRGKKRKIYSSLDYQSHKYKLSQRLN